jgi:hypothetical protein
MAVVVLIGGGWLALYVVDVMEREMAVGRIVECTQQHGVTSWDAKFVNFLIDGGMKLTGKGWKAGAEYQGLVFLRTGDSIGNCFTAEGTFADYDLQSQACI